MLRKQELLLGEAESSRENLAREGGREGDDRRRARLRRRVIKMYRVLRTPGEREEGSCPNRRRRGEQEAAARHT